MRIQILIQLLLKSPQNPVIDMSTERKITLYLIRHCQDVASQLGKFEDLKLTIEGESQAKQIGNFLLDKNITKLFTSPMIRAGQTAEIISGIISIQNVSSDLLRDRNMGQANGLSYKQVQLKFTHILRQSTFGIDFKFPDGESNGDLFDRAKSFIHEIFLTTTGTSEQIAIVSHPLILNYLLYLLTGIGFQDNLLFGFEYAYGAVLKKERGNKIFQIDNFGRFMKN